MRPPCTPGKVLSSGCHHSSASSSAVLSPREAWARLRPIGPVGFSLPDFPPSRDRTGRALVFHSSLPPQMQLLGQAKQVQATRVALEGPGFTTLTLKAAWVPQGRWGKAAGSLQILPTRSLRDKGLQPAASAPSAAATPISAEAPAQGSVGPACTALHSLSLLPRQGQAQQG